MVVAVAAAALQPRLQHHRHCHPEYASAPPQAGAAADEQPAAPAQRSRFSLT